MNIMIRCVRIYEIHVGVKIGSKLSHLTASSQAIKALENPGHFFAGQP